MESGDEQAVRIDTAGVRLDGTLGLPASAAGIVLFAHGSGSGRHSPRNQAVARRLQAGGLATLLIDLLTAEEEGAEQITRQFRFNIDLLGERLSGTAEWLAGRADTAGLRVGLFGASTGAVAALTTAARQPGTIGAVVSRGGRPDLADEFLAAVHCPSLFIVGGQDEFVLELNQEALARLGAPVKELVVVPNAGHLFEGPGQLDEVARRAADWFGRHLGPEGVPARGKGEGP